MYLNTFSSYYAKLPCGGPIAVSVVLTFCWIYRKLLCLKCKLKVPTLAFQKAQKE